MTVQSLVDARQSLSDVHNDLRELREAVAPEAIKEKVNTSLKDRFPNPPDIDNILWRAAAAIEDYENLLDTIAKQTQIPWPPVCANTFEQAFK